MRWRGTLLFLAACGGAPATTDGGADGSTVDASDGTPTRVPCTNQFGNAMTMEFGRLDGFLVAIVPPGNGGCNADTSHVHLQIKMKGSIYDVAVNVGSNGVEDVHSTTREIASSGLPWTEGWHAGFSEDYVSLGVHSSDLRLESVAQLTAELMTDLVSVNHISVLAIGYGPSGAHLVHRNGSGRDGLVITKPLSNPAHVRLFSFSAQSF